MDGKNDKTNGLNVNYICNLTTFFCDFFPTILATLFQPYQKFEFKVDNRFR